jgi:putative glutamine amidotransferase
MKPRIAIPVPTTTDLAYNRESMPAYAEAIRLSGGEPVEVALGLGRAAARAIARSCDGVCLPGSPADVDPALYGAERDPATASADPAREALDVLLLEDAAEAGKPVLAICYGLQRMNVWRGGTLVQDLTPLPVNHEAGGSVAVAHAALVEEDSLLASLLELDEAEAPRAGGYQRLPVNSSHHQCVGAPGEGLRVVARCPDDGVIEALEGAGEQFLLGVQWHPERSYAISAPSRAMFERLVMAAVKAATASAGVSR